MIWKANRRQKPDNNIIKNIPFFSGLSTADISLIESLIVKKHYAKNQIVLLEEDTANYMYFVYSGKVRVVKINEEGKEQIISIHKKNDFFGEMALLDGKTSPATVIAYEDADIGLLSKSDFERFVLNNDATRHRIIGLLCDRLRDSWAMIKILSFDNAEHRVLAVLERLQDLYGVMDDRGTIINAKLTHQQIASYASVARETVTRILNKLEKDSIIQTLENKSILLTKTFRIKTMAAN
ncbi:Crp/Fnr family transcriptional regulator [Oryzomonas japonica]|uniref:Crp/Fnr family transcriptional regulator n=1 Tax=Oryzomonas japonica TaxID=2603858 RepID=A0A7J4ZSU4_9BACT|nr:Crp/Fnr family transcriptional regulator [Oryzomonas japonica]KAB0666481.1 Crp/Fnr family transcriptional regulator [Oryzomonas japonica]